jgi:hypothetical protein
LGASINPGLFRQWRPEPDDDPSAPNLGDSTFQARQRLRPERLAALFDGVAKPLGRPAMSAVWLAGRRLVAIDGSWLVAADAVKNPVFLGARGQ